MRWAVVTIGVVLACATASAQPKPPAKKEPPAMRLNPVPWSALPNGKVITLKGMSKPEGDRFALEQLSVLQPVTIILVAENAGDQIDVVLGKDRWDEKLRSGTTDANGKVILQTRTEQELRIVVKADGDPKPYGLLVWVGDEVKPSFTPVITSMKGYVKRHPDAAKGSGGGSSPVVIVIAVSLVAIVLLLAIIAFRKRGHK